MKKILITLLITLMFISVKSQYTLVTLDGDTIQNGSVYSVDIDDINGTTEVQALLHSTSSDDIIFQVINSTQPSVAENSFCLGMSCYPPNTYSPIQASLNSNNEALLDLYYYPHGATDSAKIDYKIHKYQDENINFTFSVLYTYPTGIHYENKLSDIKVFPIPAKSEVNVKMPYNVTFFVTLYGMDGRIIKKYNSSNKQNVIVDVSDIKQGVYFLKIALDSKLKIVKFIKN